MRSSLIPRSLILVASAALSFGACGTETDPGTAANPSTAGSPSATAGTPGTPSTTAGSPGSGTAGGGAKAGTGGSVATGTAGTPAGTAGTAAGAAGTAAGAAGSTAGAAGTAAGAAGAAGGAASGGAATFTRVYEEVLAGTGCAVSACHGSPMGPSKLGLADKTVAYMGLFGVMAMGMPNPGAAGGGCAGMPIPRVKAMDPDGSLLVQKLENKQTCGMQMPPGSMLKPEQIKLVRDWIMAGAKDD